MKVLLLKGCDRPWASAAFLMLVISSLCSSRFTWPHRLSVLSPASLFWLWWYLAMAAMPLGCLRHCLTRVTPSFSLRRGSWAFTLSPSLQEYRWQTCAPCEWGSQGFKGSERAPTFHNSNTACFCAGPHSNTAFFGVVSETGVSKFPDTEHAFSKIQIH